MDQNKPKKISINELIEMGLTPQRYELHPTASSQKNKTHVLTKKNVIKQLSEEPGLFYNIQKEKDDLLLEMSIRQRVSKL